jgi:hypothetical protein
MNGKQAKRARSAAHAEAERIGLWKKGEASVFAKWWRRLLARIFPKLRRRYIDAVGRWYKRTLKDFARQAYAYIHDRDAQAFRRMQLRAARKRARESTIRRVKINA